MEIKDILIVDDDENMNFALSETLSRKNYSIDRAFSFIDAKEKRSWYGHDPSKNLLAPHVSASLAHFSIEFGELGVTGDDRLGLGLECANVNSLVVAEKEDPKLRTN